MLDDTSSATSVALPSADCRQSPTLGSLYDSKNQCFVKHYRLLREPTSSTLHRSTDTYWWKINEDDNRSFSTVSSDGRKDHQDELFSNFYLIPPDLERHRRLRQFNSSHPINTNTFFLLYSFKSRHQTFSSRPYLVSLFFPSGTFDKLDVEATHIVHSIGFGIEILFTITNPSNEISNKEVICLLNKICSILKQCPSNSLRPTDEDRKLWSSLKVQIQSNSITNSFQPPKDISGLIYWIQRMTTFYFTYDYPLEYTFQPVTCMYPLTADSKFVVDDSDDYHLLKKVQVKLLEINKLYHTLVASVESIEIRSLPAQTINQTNVEDMKRKISVFFGEIQYLYRDMRQGEKKISDLFNKLSSPSYNELCQMITELQKECDTSIDSGLTSNDPPEDKQQILLSPELTSTQQQQQIENEIQPIVEPSILSVGSSQITDSNENDNLSNIELNSVQNNIESFDHSLREKIPVVIPGPPPRPVKYINMLLIGQSGVGKSTFINAFVNYLSFKSIEDAKNGEPVALIPVSFLMTSGFRFDETVIRFGGTDVNENYEHEGQSVTQDCRSYAFDISDEIRLRIIDTPGIGDTRGIEQDKKNIDQILLSINQFSHINAICILLPPNISRLEIFFRFCMTEIFSYLSPDARSNIVFCFTNVRSTFYAPGNTGPLLRTYLKTSPMSDVSIGKKNTFCFDSESFRYLACFKQNFHFDDGEDDVYVESWNRSVPESIRLFKYIHSLKPYEINRWKSKGHAKIQIQILVRPMMEALRTLLINEILFEENQTDSPFVLIVKEFDDPNENPSICYRCSTEQSSMTKSQTHFFNHRVPDEDQQCDTCGCDFVDHELIDYEIDYQRDEGTESSVTEPRQNIENFQNVIEKFSSFLESADLYLVYLDRFRNQKIPIETKSSTQKFISKLNQMTSKLERLQLTSNVDLDDIYKTIIEAKLLPLVKVQLEAIEKRHELMQNHNEKLIHIPKGASEMLVKLTEGL